MSATIEPVESPGPRECKIADALSIIGDRWSLLVIREISYGVQRFTDILNNTGAPRQILTARLRKLELEDVIERIEYQQRPARYEYRLTASGRALTPVLSALREWGETYA